MTRAVLPNPSARAEWLLAGIIDRALNHWVTTITQTQRKTRPYPDDDDDHDIASLASQPSVSVQPSSL